MKDSINSVLQAIGFAAILVIGAGLYLRWLTAPPPPPFPGYHAMSTIDRRAGDIDSKSLGEVCYVDYECKGLALCKNGVCAR